MQEKLREIEQNQRGFDLPTDFVEFASLCQIRSGSSYVPFKLFDYQVELAKLIDQYPKLAVSKTRQLGASELIACKMLHRSFLNRGYSGVVLSIGQDESSKISERVQQMPQLQGFQWKFASSQKVQANNCGSILFRPSTDNAARSLPSVTDLMLDEAGFIKSVRELYASAVPAQEMAGPDAKTYVVSTIPPEGELSWFWEIFSSDTPAHIDLDAKIAAVQEGRGQYGDGLEWWIDDAGWCKVLLHWKSHPIYSQVPDYLEKTKLQQKLADDKLQREYNLGLPKSGGSLFNAAARKKQAVGRWTAAVPGRAYLVGIDPNFGGDDFFTCQVWDISAMPYQLVHQYHEAQQSNVYSRDRVIDILDAYRPVLVAVEANGGGIAIAESIIEKRPSIRVETVQTTNRSKVVNTDRIAFALEQGHVIYPPDWVGVQEMANFLALDRQAKPGGHDDCVMAWAISFAHLETALGIGVYTEGQATWSY